MISDQLDSDGFKRGPPPPPPPAPQVNSRTKASKTWTCQACTLINVDSRDRCEACGRRRKKKVPPMKPPKLSLKEKQRILSKSSSHSSSPRSHSSTFRSEDEEKQQELEERQDVEEEKRQEEKRQEKKRQQEKQQEDDALKIELARIKAEKEEAERRLAAAESALRRMAEEQSVKKKKTEEQRVKKKKTEEQSVKKTKKTEEQSVKKKKKTEEQSVKKETEVVNTREKDMKRLHELVPSAKSDMSVRAVYMKGARLLHPARGGDPKLYEELTHIYERLQKGKETMKKKIQNSNPFISSTTNVDTSTSSPLSEEQQLKIANFIRRERSKDWTVPSSSRNPFALSDKPRRQSNNPFSPASSRERIDSPIKIEQPAKIKLPTSPVVVVKETEEELDEDSSPQSYQTKVVGKPRISILIEHEGVMMVPRREDSANDPKVVLNMRLVDSIRWVCCSCVEKSCVDVVIMKNSAPQEEEKEDIFNWKVEYDVKTGRRIYSCRDETTQKRKRSWYSPYARQNETWIETVHPILPNSKVRVVYGEHVGMMGVAMEWSSQLKRWKVRLEYDESDRMAETLLLSPDCLENLNLKRPQYVGPPVFYTNKKTREATTVRPEDFDQTARRHSRVASALLKLRGVNSVSDIVVKGTLSRRVNAALDSLKKNDEDVSMAVFVLTRDSGNARGTSRPVRTTGQVRSRIGDLKSILGRSRSDVVFTNVIRLSRSPISLPVTPAHYVEEIMCRLSKMTMSSRLSKFANLIHWELANGEGDPPVLTQWRSESESRKCKILMGTLGVGAFGTVLPAVDENGRVVALKTFSVSTLMATNMYEAVTKELTVMCRLNKAGGHKNVIRIHELFESKDKIYLSMELARGGSFLDMLRGKVSTQMHGQCLFDLNTARKLFRQLLQGVLHMHRHNIVHRDIKPDNILISSGEGEPVLKLCDFGCACWVYDDPKRRSSSLDGTKKVMISPDDSAGLSHTNTSKLLTEALGTPVYAAPEVLSLQPYDGFKVDAWSCGVVLYTLLVGKIPFPYDLISEFTRLTELKPKGKTAKRALKISYQGWMAHQSLNIESRTLYGSNSFQQLWHVLRYGTLSWYESEAKDAKMIGSVKLDGYVPKVIDEITFKLMHASETRVDVMCKVAERTDRDRWIEAIKLASIPMKNLKVERMSSKQAKKEAEKFYVLDERVEAWRRLDNETRDLMYGMLDLDPHLRLGVQDVLIHPWMRPDARTRMQGDLNLRFTFSSQKVKCVLGRGVIRFDDNEFLVSQCSLRWDKTDKDSKKFTLINQLTNKTYKFEADTVESRQSWIEAFRKEMRLSGVVLSPRRRLQNGNKRSSFEDLVEIDSLESRLRSGTITLEDFQDARRSTLSRIGRSEFMGAMKSS